VLQRPLELGADVVVHPRLSTSTAQGRTLGGAILGPRELIEGEVKTLMRNTGPSLSPFNAWVLTKGLETLRMRVSHSTAGAERIARWLEEHPRVDRVLYPWLESHPQHDLAKAQMSGGGTVVTFEVDGGRSRRSGARPAGDRRHLQQPRRREVVDHPPGHDHAPPDGSEGGPASASPDGIAALGRPRGRGRPPRGLDRALS
jgi:hypothetical protein